MDRGQRLWNHARQMHKGVPHSHSHPRTCLFCLCSPKPDGRMTIWRWWGDAVRVLEDDDGGMQRCPQNKRINEGWMCTLMESLIGVFLSPCPHPPWSRWQCPPLCCRCKCTNQAWGPGTPPRAPSHGSTHYLRTGCPCWTWRCGPWRRSPCSISGRRSACYLPRNGNPHDKKYLGINIKPFYIYLASLLHLGVNQLRLELNPVGLVRLIGSWSNSFVCTSASGLPETWRNNHNQPG